VSPSVVKRLLDLARRAPSSMNGQPWHFVVAGSASKQGWPTSESALPAGQEGVPADFVARAPVVVVICVDVKTSYDRDLEKGVLAAGHLLLAARALGLGSVYMSAHTAGRPALRAEIKKLLRIPTGVEPVSIVPLGYPARRPDPKTLRDLWAMVHDERF
jgi:nitroreductase